MQTLTHSRQRQTLSLFDRKRPFQPGAMPGTTLSSTQLKQIVADMLG